jgi:hypothetical protein
MQDEFYNDESIERWLVTFQERLDWWVHEVHSRRRAQALIDFANDGRLTTAPNDTEDEKVTALGQ